MACVLLSLLCSILQQVFFRPARVDAVFYSIKIKQNYFGIEISYNYWIGTGIKFVKSCTETHGVVAKEIERNLHSVEISRLEQQEGFKINLDINFPEVLFRDRLNKILYDHNLQKMRAGK